MVAEAATLAIAIGSAAVALVMGSDGLWLERPARGPSDLYRVALPAGPDRAALLLATLHGLLLPPWRRLLHGQPNLSLELVGSHGQAYLRVAIPRDKYRSVARLIHASYPDAELIPEDDADERQLHASAAASARLHYNDFLPIRLEPQAGLLTPLLAVLAEAGDDEAITLQVLVQPLPTSWRDRMLASASRLRQRSSRQPAALFGPAREHGPSRLAMVMAQQMERKAEGLPFACAFRVVVRGNDAPRAHGLLWDVAASLRAFSGPNSFDFRRALSPRWLVRQVEARHVPFFGRFILNTDELAQLWNIPADLPAHLLHATLPVPLPALDGDRVLGTATYGPPGRLVAQSVADARLHTHILGPTGVGKSVLTANLIRQDIEAGRGVAVLDPNADLVSRVLARLPRHRLDEVVLISPHHHAGKAIGINPLYCPPGEDPTRLADNVLAGFRRLYEQWWGPRIEEIIRSSLLSLVHYPGATLAHIPPLLTDPLFQAEVTKHLDDPIGVGSFWALWSQFSDRQRLEAVTPVLSRLRAFLSLPRVRRLLCQPTPTVDLPAVVANGGIVLVDLASAVWGESSARLVGSLIFSQIWTAARGRLALPEAARTDYHVYVDEAPSFINLAGSFADVLATARAMRLPLTLVHQHLGQLSLDMREAVMSNARTRVVFQCGQNDAVYLAREFAPLKAEALMNLPAYHAAVRLAVEGRTSRPFTIRTLALPAPIDPTVADDAAARSAEQFGRPVDVVDAELREALRLNHPPEPGKQVGRRARS